MLHPPYDIASAIAYTRVSTARQKAEGDSLTEQRMAIDTYADKAGIAIEEWFEEVASAYGRDSVARRPRLQEAVAKARALGVPIVVATFDRLSRDLKSFGALMRSGNLVVISAEEGICSSLEHIEARIARAEEENRRRSRANLREYAERRALGRPHRNPNLEGAREKSAEVRTKQAQENAEHLVQILREHPDLAGLSLQKLADALGARRLVDRRGRPWTKGAIHAAKTRLRATNVTPAQPAGKTREYTQEEEELMQSNPYFGRF